MGQMKRLERLRIPGYRFQAPHTRATLSLPCESSDNVGYPTSSQIGSNARPWRQGMIDSDPRGLRGVYVPYSTLVVSSS